MAQTFATSAERDAYIRELDQQQSLEGRRAYQRAYQRRLREENPEKVREYARKHNAAKRERRRRCPKERARRKIEQRRHNLRKHYGLTIDCVERILTAQDGQCATCKTDITTGHCVDHCHTTGKVRELLCRNCNFALGHAADDPARLRALADYLEKHQTQKTLEP